VRAEVAAAASNKNFHLSQIDGQAFGQRVQFH
jgi:hypothetical protein